MRPVQIRARAIAAAYAVLLIMSLSPTTSYAQVQGAQKASESPIPETSASVMPGSAMPPGAQMNALTNNPNGSDWLKKFDRQPKDMPMQMQMQMQMQMPTNGMRGKMSHKMMMEHRMMTNRMKKPSMSMPMPKPPATK